MQQRTEVLKRKVAAAKAGLCSSFSEAQNIIGGKKRIHPETSRSMRDHCTQGF